MKFDESLTAPENTTSASVLKDIKEKVDQLYALKLVADKAEKAFKDAKNVLAKILEEAEVDKVQGDSATVSLSLKTSCTVPKEDSKKKELFEYIKKHHGDTVLFGMQTINARSFSSWHDAEVERHVIAGDIDFKLPMVEPYTYYSLGMRKRTKK